MLSIIGIRTDFQLFMLNDSLMFMNVFVIPTLMVLKAYSSLLKTIYDLGRRQLTVVSGYGWFESYECLSMTMLLLHCCSHLFHGHVDGGFHCYIGIDSIAIQRVSTPTNNNHKWQLQL